MRPPIAQTVVALEGDDPLVLAHAQIGRQPIPSMRVDHFGSGADAWAGAVIVTESTLDDAS